jgi:hypothetical protein
MPILMSLTPDSMRFIALSRSASIAEAGMMRSHLSFQVPPDFHLKNMLG